MKRAKGTSDITRPGFRQIAIRLDEALFEQLAKEAAYSERSFQSQVIYYLKIGMASRVERVTQIESRNSI